MEVETMRKGYILILLTFLAFFGTLGIFGQSARAEGNPPGIYDDAGLFSGEEAAELSEKIQKTEGEEDYHVLIVTTADTGGKTTAAYADDFFEAYNGEGPSGAGVLFLIDMQHRQLYISTGGEAVIRAFTDKKIE